jgi:hypothetical protein
LYVDSTNDYVGIGTAAPAYKLHISDSTDSAAKYAQFTDLDASGTAASNLSVVGHYIDLDSSMVGTQSDGSRVKTFGEYTIVNVTGETFRTMADYNYVSADTTTTVGTLYGNSNYVRKSSTGDVTILAASHNFYGNDGSGGTVSNAYGVYSQMNQDDAGSTTTNSYAFYGYQNHDGGTSTNAYILRGAFDGTHTNKYGVYITGETTNYFSGNVGIGVTSPSALLDVAGNMDIDGNIQKPSSSLYINAAGASSDVVIQTGGTDKFKVVSDGRLWHDNSYGGLVPSGMIGMFDTACPSGWTEVTSFQNKVARGHDADATYCETGGSDSHQHNLNVAGVYCVKCTGSGYWINKPSDNVGYYGGQLRGFSSQRTCGTHCYCYESGVYKCTDTVSNIPAFREVVFCKKD